MGSRPRVTVAAGADPATARAPRSAVALVAIAILGTICVAALLGLGIWQVERRSWKLDLIRRVDARVHAAPVAVPGPARWASIDFDHDAYTRVAAHGRFLTGRDTRVKAVTERGDGAWLMVPLRTDGGFTVLVNRGFVPAGARPQELAGPAEVTGLLRLNEPGGGFLRRNDPAGKRWFSRDVAAIARAQGLGPVAPFFVDADARPGDGTPPIGGLTVIAFPNNHLIYAITWFGLAAMAAGGLALLARDERRLRAARDRRA